MKHWHVEAMNEDCVVYISEEHKSYDHATDAVHRMTMESVKPWDLWRTRVGDSQIVRFFPPGYGTMIIMAGRCNIVH